MARKAGQLIARGQSTWPVRVYLGRDPQTETRKYHNETIHGPFREAQRFLNLKLQLRGDRRVSRAAVLLGNHKRSVQGGRRPRCPQFFTASRQAHPSSLRVFQQITTSAILPALHRCPR